MWLLISGGALLAFSIYVVYCVLWHLSAFKINRQIAKKQGNIMIQPYTLLSPGMIINNMIRDQQQTGDALHSFRHAYNEYDAAITTTYGRSVIVLYSPQLIKQFFQRAQDGYYAKNTVGGFSASIRPYIRDGLLFAQNQLWSSHRKIFVQVFNYDFVISKIPSMAKFVQQAIEAQIKTMKDDSSSLTFNIKPFFSRLFGNLVMRNFFGDFQLLPIEGGDLFMYVNRFFLLIGKRGFTAASLLGKRLFDMGLRSVDREINHMYNTLCAYSRILIQKSIQKICAQKEVFNEEKIGGIIQYLVRHDKIRQRRYKGEGFDFYTYDQFVMEMLTFFFAGTDTTASMTSSMFGQLLKQGNIQQKLKKEINEATGGSCSKLGNPEIIKKLQFLNCVQKQTLRLRPSAPGIFIRRVIKQHKIGSFQMYPNMFTLVWFMTFHYRSAYFEQPLKFKPQRWMNPPNRPQLSFIPFSFGQRNCIGQQLSLMISKIAAAALFLKFTNLQLLNPNYRYLFHIVYQPEQVIIKATLPVIGQK